MPDPQSGGPAFRDPLRKRAPLLEALADGPRTQRDIRDALDVPRSTVYKALQDLEDADLVTDGAGGYRLTRLGHLAWRRHDAYQARLDRLAGARRLLGTVPLDVHLPLSLFEHGRVFVPGRHAPERPLERLEARGSEADVLRCLSPAGMPRYFADLHDRVRVGDLTVTLLVEPPARDRIAGEYDGFEAATGEAGMDLRIVDRELPFALVLFDDESIALFGYEDGVLVGAVFADDPDAVRWGERVFERHREASRPA